jgi:uncharacterized protein YjdB
MKKNLHFLFTLLIAVSLLGSLSAQKKTMLSTKGAVTPVSLRAGEGVASTPYSGTPAVIFATKPTIIEAENYDNGGEGDAYHDMDTTMNATNNLTFRTDEAVDVEPASQGGYNVGWTAAGEWLKYTVNVEEAKKYIVTARVASPSTNKGSFVSVMFSQYATASDSISSDSLKSIPKGSWQDWVWSVSDTLELVAGEQLMTIKINTDGYNLDFIEITPVDFVPVAVTGLTLSSPSLDLMGGDTVTLTATVTPENATHKQVTWKSVKTTIITVSGLGVVAAVGKGLDTITVTTEDGGFFVKCPVVVTTVDVTGVALSDDKLVLRVKDKDTLKVTITPNDAFIKTVTFKSLDTKIATVGTSTGIVTAKAIGVVKIIVTTKDGSYTDTCEVTVNPPLGIKGISSSRVVVYPNPSKDGLVNISIDKQSDDAMVNVYSITGQSLYSEMLIKGETMQLNQKLKPGLYIIKVSGKGLNEVRKLQVN